MLLAFGPKNDVYTDSQDINISLCLDDLDKPILVSLSFYYYSNILVLPNMIIVHLFYKCHIIPMIDAVTSLYIMVYILSSLQLELTRHLVVFMATLEQK